MAYKLTHPNSDLTVEAEADMVPMYQSQGWQTAPTARTPEVDKTDGK